MKSLIGAISAKLAAGAAPWLAGRDVAALWQQGPGVTLALSQATQALTVILLLLARRGVPEPEIWVPAYYCENGLVPVRQSASHLRFCPMTPQLTPDWDACERMLVDGPPDLFVLPHYFGVENEGPAARDFCDRAGALLYEDAAHVLLPVGGIGRYGDFVGYSPRKFIRLPDAGLLVVRGGDLPDRATAAAHRLPQYRAPMLRWTLRQWARRLRRPRTGPLRPRAIDDEPGPTGLLPGVWMSGASRSMLERAVPEVPAIAARDIAASQQIEAAVRRLGLEPLPRHPDAAVYMVGTRARSEAHAAEAFAALRQAGAIVDTWPGMPPEVWARPERYGAALSLRRTLLRFMPRTYGRRRPLDFIANLADPLQQPSLEAAD